MTSTPNQHARVHGYLFIAMDDDGCGNPEFCQDRAAVLEAVKRSCFSNPESLDADHLRQCEGMTDSLIEDGFITFEGDPPLHLYKLHAPAQPSGLRFPVALRKMWSGTEVQAWLDQQGELIRVSDIPEGCTPTDARVLREANHKLAQEVAELRRQASAPAAGGEPVRWMFGVRGEPLKQHAVYEKRPTEDDIEFVSRGSHVPLDQFVVTPIGPLSPSVAEPGRAEGAPIDMVLHCPACGLQHIDAPNTLAEIKHRETGTVVDQLWTNPPHRSHLCHNPSCGHIWRPADVPTNGVATVKTKGKADSPIASRPSDAAAVAQAWDESAKMLRKHTRDWHSRCVAIGLDGIENLVHAAEVAKRRGQLRTVDGFARNWDIAAPAPLQAQPAAEGLPAWWSDFIRRIAELPDRNSPDDEPESMVATARELENCALNAIEQCQPLAPLQEAAPGAHLKPLIAAALKEAAEQARNLALGLDVIKGRPCADALYSALASLPLLQPQDVGALEYEGSIVSDIHQRMQRYHDELERCWAIVRAGDAGLGAAMPLHKALETALHQPQSDPIRALFAKHAEVIEAGNDYAYCEIAYTRRTGWMAWITDKPLAYAVENPDRKVLARGQGETPEEACAAALAAPTQAQGADKP